MSGFRIMKLGDANIFPNAATSTLISAHSLTQMQNLLDSLDTTSKSSKDELLTFFVQSIFQSSLTPKLRLKHGGVSTKAQLPLVQNITTRNGARCLVKDEWALPYDAHSGLTPIHLRFVCLLGLTGRQITDFSDVKELMTVLIDVLKAHGTVSTKCDWFHGDITPMNIHIDRKGKGVLTDWDYGDRNKK